MCSFEEARFQHSYDSSCQELHPLHLHPKHPLHLLGPSTYLCILANRLKCSIHEDPCKVDNSACQAVIPACDIPFNPDRSGTEETDYPFAITWQEREMPSQIESFLQGNLL